MCDFEKTVKYLKLLDPKATKFTFQTFDESKNKDQSLCRVIHGTIEKYWDELVSLNKCGAGIFVTVNETDLKGRKAKNIIAVRTLYLDDDGDVIDPPIKPNIVVTTSKGKRHLYYLLDSNEWSLEEYKKAQKQFVTQYHGDKNAKDIARILRIPGFYNMKNPDKPFLVTADIISDKVILKDEIMDIIDISENIKNNDIEEKEYTEYDFEVVKNALECIPSDDRDLWINFGIALKNDFGAEAFTLWDEWSSKSKKYDADECERTWSGFSSRAGTVHIASIIYTAQKHGFDASYIPKANNPEDDFDVWVDNFSKTKDSLDLISASDFAGKYIPVQSFIIDQLMVSGAPISLYGAPGIGKSMISLQLCASIALGDDFMGYKSTKSKCLILSCEDDQDEIHRRLDRICKSQKWEFKDFNDNLILCCRAGEDNLLINNVAKGKGLQKTGFFKSLIATIKENSFQLIIIDNIANVFGGNENDRVDTTQFMSVIYRLCKESGISILLLGHPNKSGDSYSGSTAWDAAVRQRLMLKHDDKANLYYLECEKANYLPQGIKIGLEKTEKGIFVEAFTKEDNIDNEMDMAALKSKTYNEIKSYNERNETISFSQNSASFYIRQFKFSGFSKNKSTKYIHQAIRELRMKKKLITDGKSKKIIAV